MKRIVPAVLCLLLVNINTLAFTVADTVKTPTGQDLPEMLMLTRPLLSTSNPAVISLIPNSVYNRSETGITVENRDLRFIQQPGYIFSYKAKTEGFKSLGRMKFSGDFCYLNDIYNDLILNSTLDFEPFNPILLGDTISGTQKKEQFSLNGTFSYEINDNFVIGTRFEYISAIGAKEVDARSLNKISEFKVIPGILYKFGNKSLGLSAFIANSVNQIDFTTIGYNNISLFSFSGVGFCVETSIDYFDQRYVASEYGGALQYSSFSDRTDYTSEVKYTKSKTDSNYGTTYRLSRGYSRETEIMWNNTMNVKHNNLIQTLKINAGLTRFTGDRLVQALVRYPYGDYWQDVRETLFSEENIQIADILFAEAICSLTALNSDNEANIYIGLSGKFENVFVGRYPLSKHGYYEATNIICTAEARKSLRLKKLLIEPCISVSLRQNIASDVSYVTDAGNYPEIVYYDHNYLSSNLYGGSFSVKLEKQVKGALKTVYLVPTVALTKSPDLQNESLKNTLVGMNLGLTFGD